jgi:ABC-2 type transport system permease protein
VIQGLGLAAVLPLIALIVGTGVLGSEIEDGTLLHVLAKPLPRYEILLTKLAVAAGVTAAAVAPPLFVAGMLAESAAVGLALAARRSGRRDRVLRRLCRDEPPHAAAGAARLVYVVLWEGCTREHRAGYPLAEHPAARRIDRALARPDGRPGTGRVADQSRS